MRITARILWATVATKLLSADVSPDIIFSFLGHSDRESLGHYIRLDIENLRECALSFEDGDLYEQNLRVQKRTGKSNKCFYCRKAGLRM